MDKTALGNRMKSYEHAETGRRCMPLLPVCVRLDGKAFHTWTKGLDKPYHSDFISVMKMTTEFLVEETNACIGYTQSDEISLIYYSDDPKSQIFYGGKIFKMTSVLASMATVEFNRLVAIWIPTKRDKPAYFDCRVWQVPTKEEAVNTLVWREQDATRNSILAAAQSEYSHKEMQGKNTSQCQDMLHAKGINWNNYPADFKRGSYYQRYKTLRRFTSDEWNKLPEKHAARKNPELMIERSEVRRLNMLPIAKVVNRVEVVFDGAAPITD